MELQLTAAQKKAILQDKSFIAELVQAALMPEKSAKFLKKAARHKALRTNGKIRLQKQIKDPSALPNEDQTFIMQSSTGPSIWWKVLKVGAVGLLLAKGIIFDLLFVGMFIDLVPIVDAFNPEIMQHLYQVQQPMKLFEASDSKRHYFETRAYAKKPRAVLIPKTKVRVQEIIQEGQTTRVKLVKA